MMDSSQSAAAMTTMALEANIRAPAVRKVKTATAKVKAVSLKLSSEEEISENGLDESAAMDVEMRDINPPGPQNGDEGKEPD